MSVHLLQLEESPAISEHLYVHALCYYEHSQCLYRLDNIHFAQLQQRLLFCQSPV